MCCLRFQRTSLTGALLPQLARQEWNPVLYRSPMSRSPLPLGFVFIHFNRDFLQHIQQTFAFQRFFQQYDLFRIGCYLVNHFMIKDSLAEAPCATASTQ